MPALDDDDQQAPILPAVLVPKARAQHPSPIIDGLRLEAISPKEAGYLGHVFGVDTPYLMVPTGWGEWIPLIYGNGA